MTWRKNTRDIQEEASKSRKAKKGRASVKGAKGVREEQIIFARIMALAGDFIVIYAVDPVTDNFVGYNATRDYEGLGLTREGKDFFETARAECCRAIYQADLNFVITMFTKEKVMAEIEQNGIFEMTYRLMIAGTPTYVRLKAVLVKEQEGPRLIVGVSNIDARVKLEQKYATIWRKPKTGLL